MGYDAQTSRGREKKNCDRGMRKLCNAFSLAKRCQHGTFEGHRKMISDMSLDQSLKKKKKAS